MPRRRTPVHPGRGLADAAVVALPPMVVLGLMILIVGRALSRLDPARLVSSFARARTWRLGGWRVPGACCSSP